MSVWAKAWAYEQRCGKVRAEGRYAGKYKGNPTAKAVLVAVAEFADERGRCWAGQDTIAEMGDMEERTVREQLAYLEDDLELIRREPRRRADGTRTSDMIYLLAPPERLHPPGGKADPRREPPENCAGGSTGKLRRDNRKTTADQPAQFSPHEPSVEPSEDPSTPTGGAEGTATAPEGKPSEEEGGDRPKPNRTRQQDLADSLYRGVMERYKVRLSGKQYGFHVAGFANVLERDGPTDAEMERTVAHMVEVLPRHPKLTAAEALQDVRFGRDAVGRKESANGKGGAQGGADKQHTAGDDGDDLDWLFGQPLPGRRGA